MTVLLRAGQSLARDAVVAVVDWSATGPAGRVQVVVEATSGLTKASWRVLAPGKLVVPDLPSPVALVAQPVTGALFDAGTTVRLSIGLRSSTGVQEDVVVEGVDLSAGPELVLATLSPLADGTWEVARPESRDDVDLPPGVREAFYAARKATGGASRPQLRPVVGVDVSASLHPHLSSGLVADVLDAVAGVCAQVCGASEPVSYAVLGPQARSLAHVAAVDAPASLRAALSDVVQRSGTGLRAVLERADAEGRGAVVVVSDAPPPDLEPALLSTGSRVRVVLVLLATTAWAALPADRPAERERWRDEASWLAPSVEAGRVGVVSVPRGVPLTADRASALAERLGQEVLA